MQCTCAKPHNNTGYEEEIVQTNKSTAVLEKSNELLTAELTDLKIALSHLAARCKLHQVSLRSVSSAPPSVSAATLELSAQNSALEVQNRQNLDAFERIARFARKLAAGSLSGTVAATSLRDLSQLIAENEALHKLFEAGSATEPVQNASTAVPRTKTPSPPAKDAVSGKAKFSTCPSRNSKRKRRGVAHIRSLSLNSNQWEEIFSSSPNADSYRKPPTFSLEKTLGNDETEAQGLEFPLEFEKDDSDGEN